MSEYCNSCDSTLECASDCYVESGGARLSCSPGSTVTFCGAGGRVVLYGGAAALDVTGSTMTVTERSGGAVTVAGPGRSLRLDSGSRVSVGISAGGDFTIGDERGARLAVFRGSDDRLELRYAVSTGLSPHTPNINAASQLLQSGQFRQLIAASGLTAAQYESIVRQVAIWIDEGVRTGHPFTADTLRAHILELLGAARVTISDDQLNKTVSAILAGVDLTRKLAATTSSGAAGAVAAGTTSAVTGPSADEAQVPLSERGRACFIATAAYGSELAPEVQFLRHIRDEVLRKTRWGREFFDSYWRYYYRISPTIAAAMQRDPELNRVVSWSIVTPWTNYYKLLITRPDWDRIDMDALPPELREFLQAMRAEMDVWLSAIELPKSFMGRGSLEAVQELNVALDYVVRTGGLRYLDELTARAELPLRYAPEEAPRLREELEHAGRTREEVQRILG